MAEVKIYWFEFHEQALSKDAVTELNKVLHHEFLLDFESALPAHKVSFYAKWMLHKILEKDFSLKNALSTFTKDQHGKPSIQQENLHFNISHSGKLISIAICETAEIGLDIQQVKKYSEGVAKRIFCSEETELYLDAVEKSTFFFDTWSKKEASVKATGLGIKTGLSTFSVAEKTVYLDNKQLHLQEVKIKKGYSSAIAVNHPISKIIIKEYRHEI
ncbi:MAG: 4'-phosphopantetheinyl transferase [Saprospiraceae bacterium]